MNNIQYDVIYFICMQNASLCSYVHLSLTCVSLQDSFETMQTFIAIAK